MSVLSLLLALCAVLALFLWMGGSLRSLGALAADTGESVTGALGGGTQTRALRQMQAIAEANSQLHIERGRFGRSLAELSELGYHGFSAENDPWGNPWRYQASGSSWQLTSYGADGRPGPPPRGDWHARQEASDLIMRNGAFTQAPQR